MLGTVIDSLISFFQTFYFLLRLNIKDALGSAREWLTNILVSVVLLCLTAVSTPLAIYLCLLRVVSTLSYSIIKKFKPDHQSPGEQLATSKLKIEKLNTILSLLNLYSAMTNPKADSLDPVEVEYFNFNLQEKIFFEQFLQDRKIIIRQNIEFSKKVKEKIFSATSTESSDTGISERVDSDEKLSEMSPNDHSQKLFDLMGKLNSRISSSRFFPLLDCIQELRVPIKYPENYTELNVDEKINCINKMIDQYAEQCAMLIEAWALLLDESNLDVAIVNDNLKKFGM